MGIELQHRQGFAVFFFNGLDRCRGYAVFAAKHDGKLAIGEHCPDRVFDVGQSRCRALHIGFEFWQGVNAGEQRFALQIEVVELDLSRSGDDGSRAFTGAGAV